MGRKFEDSSQANLLEQFKTAGDRPKPARRLETPEPHDPVTEMASEKAAQAEVDAILKKDAIPYKPLTEAGGEAIEEKKETDEKRLADLAAQAEAENPTTPYEDQTNSFVPLHIQRQRLEKKEREAKFKNKNK